MNASFFKRVALGGAAALALGVAGLAAAGGDFGQDIQKRESDHSQQNFGVGKPLEESSTDNINAATAEADPRKLVELAKGLEAKKVAIVPNAPNIDMMALWPNSSNPQWLIACNEEGAAQVGLIRIKLSDGSSEVIVKSGLSSCDPVHRTPWGTIVFAEENGSNGRFFEMIDPLNTTNVIIDPVTSVVTNGVDGSGAANIVLRPALGKLSYEGIAVYPSGVVYYGDEKRPLNGNPGGAYFKFIPTTLRTSMNPVGTLADSPLVSGNVYGLRLGKRGGNTDYGQASQTGLGTWVMVTTHGSFPNLGLIADTIKLTGYYRPEDIAIDMAAQADGKVRWCGANTGNEAQDHNYGEFVCVTDGTLAQAGANSAVPELQFLVMGNPFQAMMDNVAYQPGRGNWFIQEDGDQLTGHNDLWGCMDDGQDENLLSDSCIRIGSLNDEEGEWTGGVFNADGSRFFVSIQHNISGKGIVLEITGWK